MPESNEGRIQMAKIEQKLDDHIQVQNTDMNEIKGGITRIETKLDIKADRDAVEKVALNIDKKADKEQLDKLDGKFWAVIMAIIVSFIGLLVTAAKVFLGKI